jgi:hypothetical protein
LLILALLAFVDLIGLGGRVTFSATFDNAKEALVFGAPSTLRPYVSGPDSLIGPAGQRQNRDGQSRLRSRTPAR